MEEVSNKKGKHVSHVWDVLEVLIQIFLLPQVISRVADPDSFPNWLSGNFFYYITFNQINTFPGLEPQSRIADPAKYCQSSVENLILYQQ